MQPTVEQQSAGTQSESLDTLSDEALLARVVMQDTAAYEQLYARYAAQAYGLILRIVKNQAVADEVLQETFWQIWTRAEQYRGSGKVAAWLLQTARNRSLDQLRRRKARPMGHAVDDATLEGIAAGADSAPDATLWQTLRTTHVQQALADLPPEQRVCIELAYFEGMTQQRIAQVTGASLGTVKSRLRLGMEKLEYLLRAQGYP